MIRHLRFHLNREIGFAGNAAPADDSDADTYEAERRAAGHYEADEVLTSGYRVIENDSVCRQLATALNAEDDAEFGRLFRVALEAQRFDYHFERVEAGQ